VRYGLFQVVLMTMLTVVITGPLCSVLPHFAGRRLLPRKEPASSSELRALDPAGSENESRTRGDPEQGAMETRVMFGRRGLQEVAVEIETVT
jgi:hypothetical protein